MNQILVRFLLFLLTFHWSTDIKTQHESKKMKSNLNTFKRELTINDNQINRGVTGEQTKDGGFIITGVTGSDIGKEDVFLMKTNVHGEKLWHKTYGGNKSDNGWAVRQSKDGGYIIVGYTNSFGNGKMDIYLIKADSNGNEIWSKTFGGQEDEFGWDVRVLNEGGYIIASQTNSYGKGEIDAYLVKVDEDGNELWSKTYGGNEIDRIFSVQQTSDGGFISAGITYSYASIGPNDRDGYILKTDSVGNEEWRKIVGENNYDVAHSIANTLDGGAIITGYGESYAKGEGTDVYFVKIDRKGKIDWKKALNGQGNERGIKGVQTSDGGYVAVGFTEKNLDLNLVKVNSKGEKLWTRNFGELNQLEFGYTVKETSDGGLLLIGHKENLQTKQSQILLIKTDQKGKIE